jgi:hypothetical protein
MIGSAARRARLVYPGSNVAFEAEKESALQLLRGIDGGTLSTDECFDRLDEADPTLVYFILRWLKKHYHDEHERHEDVRTRLKELTNTHRSLTRKAKEGESDPVVEWFESSYKYRDVGDEEFIDLVVEKLEG